jgi:hypothetical protein
MLATEAPPIETAPIGARIATMWRRPWGACIPGHPFICSTWSFSTEAAYAAD